MSVTLRPAVEEDLDRVGHLVVHAYLADGLIHEDSPYLAELRDAAHRADQATVLVAIDDGAVVGTVTLAVAGSPYAEIARPGEAEIRMLAVEAGARGRGLGEALVRAAAQHGLSHGLEAVVLTTMPAMVAAQRMYARLGFERVPERDWSVPGQELLVYRVAARGLGQGLRQGAEHGDADGRA